jgi:hypothetical protein
LARELKSGFFLTGNIPCSLLQGIFICNPPVLDRITEMSVSPAILLKKPLTIRPDRWYRPPQVVSEARVNK